MKDEDEQPVSWVECLLFGAIVCLIISILVAT